MRVVPKKLVESIQFYEQHIQPFTTNATAIGLAAGEVTDLADKTEAARAAYQAREALRQQTEAATLALRDAVRAMNLAGAALLKKIRAKAEQVGGNSVYTLAEIPGPAIPAPVGAPGTPYRFHVTLKPDGTLAIDWKCDNPRGCNGVIYQIYRRTDPSAEWSYVGGAGRRKWIDTTLPAGAATVMYRIVGVRSTSIGDGGEFIVNFGVNGNGALAAQVSEAPTPKLAA